MPFVTRPPGGSARLLGQGHCSGSKVSILAGLRQVSPDLRRFLQKCLLAFVHGFHLEADENLLPVPDIGRATKRKISLVTKTDMKMMCPNSVPTSVLLSIPPVLCKPLGKIKLTLCVMY